MSKKIKTCQGKESFDRMNYLYQAGMLMCGRNSTLSCYYGNLCKSIAKKSLMKMEPDIKRTICKVCGLILISGISANISLDEKNEKIFQIVCNKCLKIKRFQINSEYKLWFDSSDSIKEILHFKNVCNDGKNDNSIIK